MGNLPKRERDAIRDEFVASAERIRKKYGLTIPEVRREMREIFSTV